MSQEYIGVNLMDETATTAIDMSVHTTSIVPETFRCFHAEFCGLISEMECYDCYKKLLSSGKPSSSNIN